MKLKTLFKAAFGIMSLILVTAVMNCSPAEFSNVPKPSGTAEPTHCPGYVPDPQGCLKARCQGGIANPKVYITWCDYPGANSNSLQKGDSYPADPGQFWGWVSPNEWGTGSDFPMSQRDYLDQAVTAGSTYSYRAKFLAQVPSNVSEITIPLDSCTCTP